MSSPEKNIELIEQVDLKDKIYTVRDTQVMLDFELAEIYGYETKNFNRQVKHNIERFEGEDFRFQLTKEEFEDLRCKNFTSSWGGTRYLPIAFTEQGIYMLMTVLKGPLAVEQSRRLIVYHCGTSSKDAGNKVTTITRLQDSGATISMIRQLLKHPKLTLR